MSKIRKKDRKLIREAQEPKVRSNGFKFTAVEPRTDNQRKVLDVIKNNPVSIIIGTAGTGKTLLAISAALEMHIDGAVKHIVLIRPMVTVGAPIGFLPGGINEKTTPYSTALMYYIDELMDCKGYAQKRLEAGVIEIVPVALIRGRTFKDSVIVIDEAQNFTTEEMHAILTRLGENSSMILIGDETQIDLKGRDIDSGLSDLLDRLVDHESSFIGRAHLGKEDIQRSEFLKEVFDLYQGDTE